MTASEVQANLNAAIIKKLAGLKKVNTTTSSSAADQTTTTVLSLYTSYFPRYQISVHFYDVNKSHINSAWAPTTIDLNEQRQLYIDSLWRRLRYFNSVLDDRISAFKDLGAQRRFILFLPNVDDIDEYIRQKVEEKAKQKKLKEWVYQISSM